MGGGLRFQRKQSLRGARPPIAALVFAISMKSTSDTEGRVQKIGARALVVSLAPQGDEGSANLEKKIHKNTMLSIFYRSSIHNVSSESIKILNNVYLTVSKPTSCSKVPPEGDPIDLGTRAPGEQTQTVLIKGKLGQFKVIWPCCGQTPGAFQEPQLRHGGTVAYKATFRSKVEDVLSHKMEETGSENVGSEDHHGGGAEGAGGFQSRGTPPSATGSTHRHAELGAPFVSDVPNTGRLSRPIILHDDKRFWVFKKEKKHSISRLRTKQLEDRCSSSPKEQNNSFRD